jgi:phage protein D
MSKRAIFSVVVAGQDITAVLDPILISLSVRDKAGRSSDSATIEIDDTGGAVVMPGPGALLAISLGWEDSGAGLVFMGTVDEIEASGGRQGRTLSISAKGVDTRGKAKQPQRRHFDNTTIEKALSAAGSFAGIAVKVEAGLASIAREYLSLDDESFIAFGERIAAEVGGTFKIDGSTAILASRNGGQNPAGATPPTVTAAWGVNLHTYRIAPILGRPVEASTLARWYHRKAAKWMAEVADTGTDGGLTSKAAMFPEADKSGAQLRASSDASEADRKAGQGSVTIEGNIDAQPEGPCIVSGCRPGVDGTYRIESVEHTYSRSGFVTSLELRQPKGTAGKDSR